MLVVTLEREDCVNGGFVKIGCVAYAIAKANGSSNLLDAERKILPRINAGVQLGLLCPLDPESLEPLPKEDYGNGIVTFAELVEWGHVTKKFAFKSDFISPEVLPWANAAPSLRPFVSAVPRRLPLSENEALSSDDTPPEAAAVTASAPAEADAWKLKARKRAAEIIKRQREIDAYPNQRDIADEIAREFRTRGVTGAGGKPLAGSYIKRHALKGVSSARDRQLSTKTRRGK